VILMSVPEIAAAMTSWRRRADLAPAGDATL